MTKEQLKYKVEELEKELAKFKKELDEKDKSPYCERLNSGHHYFSIHGDGCVHDVIDFEMGFNKLHYETANYFSDESFAKKVAAEQTLTNLLRKYTYEHGWSDDLWDDSTYRKYKIQYDVDSKHFEVDDNKFFNGLGTIYFVDFDTAINAIEEIVIPFVKEHPELGYELKD